MNKALEIHGVSKARGKISVLSDVTLDVAPGERVALLGHNGAGKSTLIKAVLGLTDIKDGTIRVAGAKPGSGAARRASAFLPEAISFHPALTGREQLSVFARLSGERADVAGLLDRVGLSDAMDHRIGTYSKGMRQRLGLAQALLSQPRLLLLDEPTVGLDPIATQEFYGMVDELRDQGCGVILCSHVLPGVEKHINRAAILGQGRLRALGTLTELRAQANLPMTIRVSSALARPALQQQLEDLDVSSAGMRPINGHTLEWQSAPGNKMQILRRLARQQELDDIDIQEPSLESLYRHFVELATEVRP